MVNIVWDEEPGLPEGTVLGLDTEYGEKSGLRSVQFGYDATDDPNSFDGEVAWILEPGKDDDKILSALSRYKFVAHASADYESILDHYGLDIRDAGDMLPPNTIVRLNPGPDRTWFNTGYGILPDGRPAAPSTGE